MKVFARAPARLDLAGGWTDVPPFSTEVGGVVVNIAINRYTYISASARKDGRVILHSADYGLEVEYERGSGLPYDGRLDLVKAAIRHVGLTDGVEVTVRSDVPPGAGLGASAATGVALIACLGRLSGRAYKPLALAEEAHRLETEELHVPGGRQDQYASLRGGCNYLTFLDPEATAEHIPLSPRLRCELEKSLVLCYTGHSRVSGNIISAVIGAYRSGMPETVNALHGLREVACSMREALQQEDTSRIASLLKANWEHQRHLHPSVSNPEIERLFALAEGQGALGGKATGAGGGGCLLFLCAPDTEHRVARALREAGAEILHFSFDDLGLQVWESALR